MKKLTLLSIIAFVMFSATAQTGNAVEPQIINLNEVMAGIEYPTSCKEKGIEGMVSVAMEINEVGDITRYKINSTPCEDMTKVVEEALKDLVFKPALNDQGAPVTGYVALPINFELTL